MTIQSRSLYQLEAPSVLKSLSPSHLSSQTLSTLFLIPTLVLTCASISGVFICFPWVTVKVRFTLMESHFISMAKTPMMHYNSLKSLKWTHWLLFPMQLYPFSLFYGELGIMEKCMNLVWDTFELNFDFAHCFWEAGTIALIFLVKCDQQWLGSHITVIKKVGITGKKCPKMLGWGGYLCRQKQEVLLQANVPRYHIWWLNKGSKDSFRLPCAQQLESSTNCFWLHDDNFYHPL